MFKEKLKPYLDKYGRGMLNDFYMYWTEHNEHGKKMRYEMQKTFDIPRRLATWKRNDENSAHPKYSESKFDSQRRKLPVGMFYEQENMNRDENQEEILRRKMGLI